MKKPLVLLAAAALLATLLVAVVHAASQQTLTGEYRWHQSERGSLKAVFTPAGENRWDVDFHFQFQGRPHVYSGTAAGSLVDGTLEGKVSTENKRRTFTFRGAFADDGIFRGTHAELSGGRESRTGTLTLRR